MSLFVSCRGSLHRAVGRFIRHLPLTKSYVQETMAKEDHNSDAPVYCSYPLERAAHLRTADHQSKLQQDENAELVLLYNGSALCTKSSQMAHGRGDVETVGLAALKPAKDFIREDWVEHIVFLGIDKAEGTPVFAGHTGCQEVPLPDAFQSAEWLDIRKNSVLMSRSDAALAATANGMLQWHLSNVYSEDTGEQAASIDAGWARTSPSSSRLVPLLE